MNIGDYVKIVANEPGDEAVGEIGKCVAMSDYRPYPVCYVEVISSGEVVYIYESEARPATAVEVLAAKLR